MASSPGFCVECPDCVRLHTERDHLKRVYDLAAADVRTAAGDDPGRYLILMTLADEAKIDLDLADAEIIQHQDRHAVPIRT